MNGYLLLLGSNISEMRNILNITQEELANMMGVSRPTIIKIEQDPSKLTKALAFSLFCAVGISIKTRQKEIKAINPSDYSSTEKLGSFFDKVKSASLISATTLGVIVTVTMPVIGSLISLASASGFKSFKDNQKLKQWDAEKSKEILIKVEKKILEDERKLLELFKIDSFDVELFGEEIKKGENPDYDLF